MKTSENGSGVVATTSPQQAPLRLGREAAAWSVLLVALVVRLVFCWWLYPTVAHQFGAGDDYDRIAWSLASGQGYTIEGQPAAAERLPLYPLLLAASFVVFGPVSWPWQLAQSFIGSLTCLLVLLVARRYASSPAAWLAAMVCAIHPTLTLYVARPFTETLYVFLVTALLAVCSRPNGHPALVGALLGSAFLVKSSAVLLLPLLLVAPTTHRLRRALLTVAWAALVVTPWMAWCLYFEGHTGLLTATGGRALYHGLFISRHLGWLTPVGDLNREAELDLRQVLQAHGVEAEASVRLRDRIAGEAARQWIRDHPREAVALWSRNLLRTWYIGRSTESVLVHATLHGLLFVLAVIGFPRMHRRAGNVRAVAHAALVLVLSHTVFHAVVHPAVRYILPAVPALALLAAGAFVRLDPSPSRFPRQQTH